MPYTTIKKPSDYFRTKLYQGNSTDNTTITWDETDTNFGSNLFLWLKARDLVGGAGQEHWLTDSVRGASKFLESNATYAESDVGGNFAYTTNGFVLDNNARTNRGSMVGWSWNTSGSASSNTDGSITSTVSANTTSGFSIVSWTGTGANATVGHGLGSIPKMIIVKRRSGADPWRVQHGSLGSQYHLILNETNASATGTNVWNDTEPTSSVFTIGTDRAVNGSGDTFIAYCFADVKGFSKFGSYTGNGNADGTFVYTGFKPAFLMIKCFDNARSWVMWDTKRNPYNLSTYGLLADTNDTENSGYDVDLLSNGFKLRTTGSGENGSGFNYIYMAFAEEPLVGDNPATAR